MIKVLLVDDDYPALEGLRQILRWETFNGELAGCATDGVQALSMIDKAPPDVVIADIKMPRMDGIELAGWLHEHYRNIRIILLSGHSEFEYAQKALQYRVTDYILKPITRHKIAELEKRLREISDELHAKREIRRLSGDDDLREHLLSLLRQGDADAIDSLMRSGVLVESLLHDSNGTLGAMLLDYLSAYRNEISRDKSRLSDLKRREMEVYWSLHTPWERIDHILACYQDVLTYSKSKKEEYVQPIVAHCIQMIQEHYTDASFNISQLADQANLSLSYLSTVFKQAMGQTISSYLSSQRLLKSQELLRDISIPVKDVCARSGYEDPHYFARSFKKQTGMTPSEYRNLHSSRDLHPDGGIEQERNVGMSGSIPAER